MKTSEFIKQFNEVSQSYHTCRSNLGPVAIADSETGVVVAELCADLWIFFKQSAFDSDEMALMTRLAATLPGLRGGHNDGN